MRPITILAALVLVLAGSTQAGARDRLTLLLDWFVNPDHGPLFVAQERGYFEQAGLDVEIIAPADPNDPPKLVAAGQADLAISYQPQLHIQVAEGLPLVRVGTLIAAPLNCLAVLDDSGIRSIADLRGKRIGYSVAGFEDALLDTMLAEGGLGTGDVTLVNVNFSLTPALLSGQVDAVIGAYRNVELNQMALEGHPGRAFYVEEHGVPPYDELIVIARSDRLRDDRLPRFLAAVEQGVLYLLNHPEESYRLFVQGRLELDDALNRRAWSDTIPRFALRPAALDTGRYQRFARFLQHKGLIQTVPALGSYAVDLGAE